MPSTVPDTEVNQILARLGVAAGTATRENARTCLEFFDHYYPELDWGKRISYMKAIDLHSPVNVVPLRFGARVVAWQPICGALYGDFYTIVGEAIDRMAVGTDDRRFQSYTTRQSMRVLSCRTSAFQHISFGSGGGRQLIIPRASMVLKARGHE